MKSVSWWTDERIEELKARWSNNQTARQICQALGTSRCAVIGKVRRLKLPERANRHNTTTAYRADGKAPKIARVNYGNRLSFAKPIVRAMPAPPPPKFENPKRFAELRDGDCRWPGDGDGADPKLLFCAAPVAPGRSYCAGHCAISRGTILKAPRS